jgi:hypothetical protein
MGAAALLIGVIHAMQQPGLSCEMRENPLIRSPEYFEATKETFELIEHREKPNTKEHYHAIVIFYLIHQSCDMDLT